MLLAINNQYNTEPIVVCRPRVGHYITGDSKVKKV